jgi:hypothetical protein
MTGKGLVRVVCQVGWAPLKHSAGGVGDDDEGFADRPLAPEATLSRTHVVPTRPGEQTEARNPGTRRDLSRRDALGGFVSFGRAWNARDWSD